MTQGPTRAGRPRATTRHEIEHVAIRLFDERGFEAVTVDDIAEAAGIGRRTFFRYFPSKNDVVWGEFDAGLANLARWLDECPDDLPLAEALRRSIIAFNRVPAEELPWLRLRMQLILHTAALQAHSTLMYAAWRQVIARYAARRLAEPVGALHPQLVGHLALGAAVAAYEKWLRDPDSDLEALLDGTLHTLADGLG